MKIIPKIVINLLERGRQKNVEIEKFKTVINIIYADGKKEKGK